MTEAQAHKLALSFPGAEATPHFDRTRYKASGKRGTSFCTIGGGTLNIKITPRERLYSLLKSEPEIFLDLGNWMRMGFIGIRLSKIKEAYLRELLTEAWKRVASKKELAAFLGQGADDVLRFPTAVKHDLAIDDWLAAQRADLRPLVETWFAKLRRCGRDVRELMHDGCPTACVGDAAFGHVGAYKDHVNVYFFFGALLKDPARLLEGTGKRGRHVKLRPGNELDCAALSRLIDAAYADIKTRLRP
jgi:hypothetical protein